MGLQYTKRYCEGFNINRYQRSMLSPLSEEKVVGMWVDLEVEARAIKKRSAGFKIVFDEGE